MKKTLRFVLISLVFTMFGNLLMAQWAVMDGSLLFEQTAFGWQKERWTNDVSDGPNSTYFSVVDDPDIEGNKLIKHDKRTTNTRESWRLEWQIDNDDNAFTYVLRMKPTPEILEYATTATADVRLLYFSPRTGAFRDSWNFNLPNLVESNQSAASLINDFSDWTIFRWVMKRDSSVLYINENPVPAFAGKTDSADETKVLFFGAHTNLAMGAYYDWMVWNLEGGYAPGQGPALPATLTGLPGGDPSSSRDIISGEPALFEVYPNPLQSYASVRYSVEQTSQTRLDLYDLTGRFLYSIVDQMHLPGRHESRIERGSLPAGMYFIRYSSGQDTSVRRILVK